MKIIDLLNEREKLSNERFTLSFNALFLPTGCSDEDRNVNRQYQDKVKRYNELTDRINEAYARTRINVMGYGEISLATAIEFYDCSSRDLFSDSGDCLVAFLSGRNYQDSILQKVYINDRPMFSITPCDLSFECNNEGGKKAKEQLDKVESLMKTMFCDLKAAIIKAISDTDV